MTPTITAKPVGWLSVQPQHETVIVSACERNHDAGFFSARVLARRIRVIFHWPGSWPVCLAGFLRIPFVFALNICDGLQACRGRAKDRQESEDL